MTKSRRSSNYAVQSDDPASDLLADLVALEGLISQAVDEAADVTFSATTSEVPDTSCQIFVQVPVEDDLEQQVIDVGVADDDDPTASFADLLAILQGWLSERFIVDEVRQDRDQAQWTASLTVRAQPV